STSPIDRCARSLLVFAIGGIAITEGVQVVVVPPTADLDAGISIRYPEHFGHVERVAADQTAEAVEAVLDGLRVRVPRIPFCPAALQASVVVARDHLVADDLVA